MLLPNPCHLPIQHVATKERPIRPSLPDRSITIIRTRQPVPDLGFHNWDLRYRYQLHSIQLLYIHRYVQQQSGDTGCESSRLLGSEGHSLSLLSRCHNQPCKEDHDRPRYLAKEALSTARCHRHIQDYIRYVACTNCQFQSSCLKEGTTIKKVKKIHSKGGEWISHWMDRIQEILAGWHIEERRIRRHWLDDI